MLHMDADKVALCQLTPKLTLDPCDTSVLLSEVWSQKEVAVSKGIVCHVQDPFEVSHDLGRTVDRQTSGVLHKEFVRAACILRDLPQPLDKLMDPYRAGKSD